MSFVALREAIKAREVIDAGGLQFAPDKLAHIRTLLERDRSALLPTSTEVRASTGAEWIQIAARLLGPLLVGLFAFGMRARIRR